MAKNNKLLKIKDNEQIITDNRQLYDFFTINSEKRIDKTLSKILNSNKAVICEVMMPPMQDLVPRVQTQMNEDGTFEPAMLDNMYPFISKDRIKMIRQRLLSID